MSHAFILGFIISVIFTFSAMTSAQESSIDNAEISVKSKESQHGQQVGVSTKSTPVVAKYKSKQLAHPLQKPFDRDLRMTDGDSPDFWIFDAFVNFNIDLDHDGYYSTITVEFDVDTVYNQAEVYARLYLARGDVFEEYHITSLFLIEGDSSEDQFVVESELLTGFPSDDYELLIEVYDGLNDQLVASYDGFNDADLTLLTLESRSFERQQAEQVVVIHSGGSFGYLMLLLLPVLLTRSFIVKGKIGQH